MTIHIFPNHKSREETLREARSMNIANALYMAETREEVLKGLRTVHRDNLIAMIEMINDLLTELDGGDCA